MGADKSVVGIAYYKEEEWDRLFESADDQDALPDNYAEWLESVQRLVRNARKVGAHPQKVVLTVDEIEQYCRQEDVQNDTAARSILVERFLSEGRGEEFGDV